MSRFVCKFCAHGNPEGSRFCNECGSPLNLAPCSRCEAINSASDTQCFQCGAPLSSAATEEMGAPPPAWTKTSQSAKSSPTKMASIPVALANRLEALLRDMPAVSHESYTALED